MPSKTGNLAAALQHPHNFSRSTLPPSASTASILPSSSTFPFRRHPTSFRVPTPASPHYSSTCPPAPPHLSPSPEPSARTPPSSPPRVLPSTIPLSSNPSPTITGAGQPSTASAVHQRPKANTTNTYRNLSSSLRLATIDEVPDPAASATPVVVPPPVSASPSLPPITAESAQLIATIARLEALRATFTPFQPPITEPLDIVLDRIRTAQYAAPPYSAVRAAALATFAASSATSLPSETIVSEPTPVLPPSPPSTIFYTSDDHNTPLFAPARVLDQRGLGHSIRALGDTGSGESFIVRSLALELGLVIVPAPLLAYSGVVGPHSLSTSDQCSVTLRFNARTSVTFTAYVVDSFPTPLLWGRNGMRAADGNGIQISPDPDAPNIRFDNGYIVNCDTAEGTPGSSLTTCLTSTECDIPALSNGTIQLASSASPGTAIVVPATDLNPNLSIPACVSCVSSSGLVNVPCVSTSSDPTWLPPGQHVWASLAPAAHTISPTSPSSVQDLGKSAAVSGDLPPDSDALKRGTSWNATAQGETEYVDGAIAAADLPALLDSLIDSATVPLTSAQRLEAKKILSDNIAVFSTLEDKFGCFHGYDISFKHQDATKPVFVPPRKMSPNKAAEATRLQANAATQQNRLSCYSWKLLVRHVHFFLGSVWPLVFYY